MDTGRPLRNFREDFKEDLNAAVLPFLTSRLWVAFWVYMGHLTWPYRKTESGGYGGIDNWWLNPWTAFDSHWYLEIANHGYRTPKALPFQPLYPFLLRLAGPNEVLMTAWGVALNTLCFFIALALLHRLTRRVASPTIARLTLWLLAFYPTSAIFSSIYTESVFACFLFSCWLTARKGHWFTAAAFGVLASLTRNVGLVVTLALFVEWWSQRKQHAAENSAGAPATSRPNLAALLAIGAPLLCFVGLQFYYAQLFPDRLAGVKAQDHYYRQFTFPLVPIWRDLYDIFTGQALNLVTILHVASVFTAVGLAWRYRKVLPASDAAFMLGLLLMHLTYARYIPPYTIATLRYLSTTPCFTPLLARSIEGSLSRPMTRWILCIAYFMLCAVFSFLFGQKQFALG